MDTSRRTSFSHRPRAPRRRTKQADGRLAGNVANGLLYQQALDIFNQIFSYIYVK
jgi:hypothetical protein